MEVVGLAFVAGIVMRWIEGRERRAMFPPGPCRWCPLTVYLKGDVWVHEGGQQYARWPNLDYDIPGLEPPPLHPAIPLSTGGIQ